MLQAFRGPGAFRRGNLHCHSTRSDGEMTPERVCAFYREAGYDFVCLSDHFTERYGFPVTDTTGFRTEGFTTILGAELHSGRIESGEIWHILAVGLPPDFAPTDPGESGPDLAARALAAGAFVALPHPEWYGLTVNDALSMPEGVHAVEAFNAIARTEGREGGAHLLDQMLNAGRRLGVIAVDDAHRYREDALGGWVMVRAERNTPEAILAALRSGACYASTGPEIRHAAIEGKHLVVETSPVDHAALLGQAARSRTVAGRGMTRFRLPLKRFAGSWARLVVRDADGGRAWAQPFEVPA